MKAGTKSKVDGEVRLATIACTRPIDKVYSYLRCTMDQCRVL